MQPRTRRAWSAACAVALAAIATVVTVPSASAGTGVHDVAVTVDDGSAVAVAGTTTTYTVTITNTGASTGGTVSPTSTFPIGAWSCVASGGATCTASGSGAIDDAVTLPDGGSLVYTVAVPIPANPGLTPSTTFALTFTTIGDSNSANDTSSDTDTISASTDLSVTIDDGLATMAPGQTVTYTIVATNGGPSFANGSVTVVLAAGFTDVTWTCTADPGGSCPASGTTSLINRVVLLPVGASATFQLTATLAQGTPGPTATSTATIQAPAPGIDPDPSDDSDSDIDTVTPVSDLAITITDGVTAVVPGSTVTYTVTVTNAGPTDDAATVAVPAPAGLTGVQWTCVGTGGTCTASGSGAINDAVVVAGGGQLVYTVTGSLPVDADGSLFAGATVDGTVDGNAANDSSSDVDTITDLLADLSVSKVGDPIVVAGDTIAYDITVGNDGPQPGLDVVVTDELPAGTTFVSLTQTDGPALDATTTPAVGSNGTVTVTFDELDAGDEAVLRLVVDTAANLSPGTEIENDVAVASLDDDQLQLVRAEATIDPNGLNDADSFVTTVVAEADLSVTKSLTGSLVSGTNATYTLTVKNDGPDATDGTIVVIDAMPTGLTFVSATGTGWQCEHDADENAAICFRETSLANGASSTVTVIARVTASTGTRLVNDAAVLSDSLDTDPSDNFSEVAATVVTSTTATGSGALPRTGGPVAALLRLALVAFGLGLIAFSTGSLNLLRQLPVRRRDHR